MKTYHARKQNASHVRTAGVLLQSEYLHANDAARFADQLKQELEAAARASISAQRAERWAHLAKLASRLSPTFHRLAGEGRP